MLRNGLQHFFYTLEVQVSSLLKPAFTAEDNPNIAEKKKKTHEKDSITCMCLIVETEAQEYLQHATCNPPQAPKGSVFG